MLSLPLQKLVVKLLHEAYEKERLINQFQLHERPRYQERSNIDLKITILINKIISVLHLQLKKNNLSNQKAKLLNENRKSMTMKVIN